MENNQSPDYSENIPNESESVAATAIQIENTNIPNSQELSIFSKSSNSIPTLSHRKSGISAAKVLAASPENITNSQTSVLSQFSSLNVPAKSQPQRQRSNLNSLRYNTSPHPSGASSPSYSIQSSAESHVTQLSSIIFAKDTVDGLDVVLKTVPVSSSLNSTMSRGKVEFEGFSIKKMARHFDEYDDDERDSSNEFDHVAVGAEKELEFLRELERADVQNVVRVKDSYVDENGQLTIVLPMMKKFAPGDMDLITVRNRLRQLLTILSAVHSHNIVHLDVTPANLMLNPDTNHLTLIDFGLAERCLNREQDTHLDLDISTDSLIYEPTNPLDRSHSSLTVDSVHSGSPHEYRQFFHPQGCGTPGFISPEILAGTSTTTAPDIYSAAIVFGNWLDPYLPNLSLHVFGSRLVRPQTTTQTARRLRNFVRNSNIISPRIQSTIPSGPITPNGVLATQSLLPHPRTYAETRNVSFGNLLHHTHHHHDRVSILRTQSLVTMYPISHSESCPSLTQLYPVDASDLSVLDPDADFEEPLHPPDRTASAPIWMPPRQQSGFDSDEPNDELAEKAKHKMTLLAADLLWRMLHPNEHRRISASHALEHPFIMEPDEEFVGTELSEWLRRLDMRRGFAGEGWIARSTSLVGSNSRRGMYN
ncbi:hypothetical protein HK096_008432 [Nowakowskiella sp. JEL0078]|nr:hypothetical protein HK096_008432 [Nowakowskiella sp. JEL0078]